MMAKIDTEETTDYKRLFLPIGLIFLFSFLFTFFMSKQFGDDLSFLNRLNEFGYFKASIDYYQIWSSRTVIEFFVMFFSNYFILWKICNAFIMTGTVILINKLTMDHMNAQNLFLTFALYAMIPLTLMRETGWVATTLNYHWALFFALVAFYPFYKKINGQPISVPLLVMSILAICYASSQEQMNLCFLVFTSLISCYLFQKKQYSYKLLPITILSIIGLCLFLLSPGNELRLESEIAYWFPGFKNLSFINKLDLGVSSFGKPFFIDFNFLFFSLFGLVTLLVYKKQINYYLKLLVGLPFIFNIIVYLGNTTKLGFTFYGSNGSTAIFSSASLSKWFTNTGTGFSLFAPVTWLPTLLILFLSVCLLIGLFLSFNQPKRGIVACLLFLMAFSSRLMLGFSPTVWASGVRTYFVTFVLAVILILLLITELKKTKEKEANAFIFLLTLGGLAAFFLSVFNR